MAFYPERVVFIAGGILNVVHAQSEISHRLHELRGRDRVRAKSLVVLSTVSIELFVVICI